MFFVVALILVASIRKISNLNGKLRNFQFKVAFNEGTCILFCYWMCITSNRCK